jgi:hypothetical protein
LLNFPASLFQQYFQPGPNICGIVDDEYLHFALHSMKPGNQALSDKMQK